MPCMNADLTREVPCDSPEAAYVYPEAEIKRILAERKAVAKAAAPAEDKAVGAPPAARAR